MTSIQHNVPVTGSGPVNSGDAPQVKGEQKQPEMVSIFSKYDTDKSIDKSLSYQKDSATKQYIDNGQTQTDFTSGLDKNVISKITVNAKDLWNTAVGSFSQLYSSPDVAKADESSAQSKVDSETKQILDNQIKLANDYITQAFEKAISEAKAEAEKEAKETEEPNKNEPSKQSDAPQTLDDLKANGTKFKTRTRMVNGQKQEYIMYKDANGETQRALVKDDGTLDKLYTMNVIDGSGKKSFVSESMLREKFGDNANFEQLSTQISFDNNGEMKIHGKGIASYVDKADANGFNGLNDFMNSHPGSSVKERFVDGQRQLIVTYKDENGEKHNVIVDKNGTPTELYKAEGTGGVFKGINEAAYYTSGGAAKGAAHKLGVNADAFSKLGIEVSVSFKGGKHFEYKQGGKSLTIDQVKSLLKNLE